MNLLFQLALLLGGIVIVVPLFFLLALRKRGQGIVYNNSYQPNVAVVTPMFNEGANIRRTLESILAQDYPAGKREIIVVDDCSTDDSYAHAMAVLRGVPGARVLRNEHNLGKRKSINRAVESTTAEIIVSVDSDVVVDPSAIGHMIRCFSSERVGAVGGRVAILNERDNWLTRTQSVLYYYSYYLIKRVELRFRSVMCLSGCLTAYRRHVLQELSPVLEHRNVLGVEIKYGEDRFLTRMIVKAGYETIMNLHAVCRTVAPTSPSVYLSQQLRWRRSNMVDYFGSLSHVWKTHPLVSFYFLSLFAVILLYPVLLVSAVVAGKFWDLMGLHLVIAFLLGVAYRLHAYKDPNATVWNAIPLAVLFPLTYGILTPLALLTLDASSWETRGQPNDAAVAQPVVAVPTSVAPAGASLQAEPRPVPVFARVAMDPRPVTAGLARTAMAVSSVTFPGDELRLLESKPGR